MSVIEAQGRAIQVSNPEKVLWDEPRITKAEYIKSLLDIASFLLPHTEGKELTAIRYPNGVNGKFFYQKRPPEGSPDWVSVITNNGDPFIDLNSLPTLLWLGNLAALEFHTPFSKEDGMLRSLVFDLDPSKGQTFADAVECALMIHETLSSLGIESLVKTSGASGLQIYITVEKMTFEQGRIINTFFGRYFAEKFPALMTIERQVKKRGKKLYFDYLQMWRGKNIISVYSPRAVECAAVSMPVTWDELKNGAAPCDFNLKNAATRLNQKGDMFAALLHENSNSPAIDEIFKNRGLNGLRFN